MRFPLVARVTALVASAVASIGAGGGPAEARAAGAQEDGERSRSPRAIANVSASASVLAGVTVKWPGPARPGAGDPWMAPPADVPANVSRSTYVDRARGVVVISLDLS